MNCESCGTPMKIVKATPQHLPGILELWKYLTDYHHQLDPRGLLPISRRGYINFSKYINKRLQSDRNQVLVALAGNKVMAYSLASIIDYPPIYTIKRYGLITDICVECKYQRKGVGTKMLAKILAWFKSRRIRRIELVVSGQNKIGYSFWKKHGFNIHYYTLYLNKK